MSLIETALGIALDAHRGQTDKAGAPYITHPLRMMMRMESETLQAAAVLHDVLEDSDYTEDDLREAGIPEDVIEIVKALTNPPQGVYEDFIGRISYNPDAIRVKLADIEDNLNVLRIAWLTDKDLARVRKYHQAWRQLKLALDRFEGQSGHVVCDEPAVEKARLKGRWLQPDDPIYRRGYVTATPANSVYPGRPKGRAAGEGEDDSTAG